MHTESQRLRKVVVDLQRRFPTDFPWHAPSSHHKIFPHKICSKGWVNLFLIGSLTAALRLSKGWVRKDLNLVIGIGCTACSGQTIPYTTRDPQRHPIIPAPISSGPPERLVVLAL